MYFCEFDIGAVDCSSVQCLVVVVVFFSKPKVPVKPVASPSQLIEQATKKAPTKDLRQVLASKTKELTKEQVGRSISSQ